MAYTLVNTATMPGDDMDPDGIDDAARSMRAVAKAVSARGGRVLSRWATVSDSYEAPEQETLFAAMDPVPKAAAGFGGDVGKAATALETFAEEVRAIKKTATAIRADVAGFVGGINAGGGKVTLPGMTHNRHGGVPKSPVDWYEDQATVDRNNQLVDRISNLQEELEAAERTCANAINAISGAPPIGPVTSGSNGAGYGLEDIPADAPMPWGSAVTKKESCAEKVVEGAIVDSLVGGLEGATSLVGVSWSGPEGLDHSWSTAGDTWTGAFFFGVGAVTHGPLAIGTNNLPGPVGDFFRRGTQTFTSGVAGMVGIDPYAEDPFQKWKDDPWRTLGSTGFNVATIAAAPLKVGQVAKVGAAGKGSRLADPADAARKSPIDISNALKSLDDASPDAQRGLARNADVDDAVRGIKNGDLDLGSGQRNGDPADTDPGRGRTDQGDPSTSPENRQPEADRGPGEAPATGSDRVDQDVAPDPKAVEAGSGVHTISTGNRAGYESDVAARKDLAREHTAALRERNALARDLGVSTRDLTVDKVKESFKQLERSSADPDKVDRLRALVRGEYETGRDLNKASEELGMSAGKDVITSTGGRVLVGDGPGPGRRDELDLIGLSSDGKTLIVVEAKGGNAKVGTREVDGVDVQQGSSAYLNDLLKVDARWRDYLEQNPALARSLAQREVTVEYKLVRARVSGSVKVVDFKLDEGVLDLSDLKPGAVPAGR